MNEHYLPDVAYSRFEQIEWDQILNERRRYLCLDLDNTLVTQRGMIIADVVRERVRELQASPKVSDICLVSNVIVPGRRVNRLRKIAAELGIRHVVPCYFFNRKPKASPFLQALSLLNAQANECVMVGDQIFSDILGANRLGFFTIWLEPMSPDHWTTLMTGRRRRERVIVKEIEARGLLKRKGEQT